jgi:hypothetical protein
MLACLPDLQAMFFFYQAIAADPTKLKRIKPEKAIYEPFRTQAETSLGADRNCPGDGHRGNRTIPQAGHHLFHPQVTRQERRGYFRQRCS